MAAGSHVLKIDGYSITSNPPCAVPRFRSCPFHAGGRTWHISYFPKGSRRTNTDCLSLFLVLADADAGEAVTAQATFSLLDQDQKPVPSYSRTTAMVSLSASRSSFGYERFMRTEDLEQSGHLIDDCFALRVDVHAVVMEVLELFSVVKKPSRSAAALELPEGHRLRLLSNTEQCRYRPEGRRYPEAPSIIVVPPSDMHRHIGDLLSSEGPGADLEFRVGRDTFPAHRLVLSARSPVFRAELFDSAKDGTSVIHIEDMEAPVFRALLTFIYTDALPEMDPKDGDEYSIARHLLVAADKYMLERLKLICEGRLRSHINTSSAATILLLADKYRCPCLKEACFEFLSSSSKVLFDVIETEEFVHLAQSVPAVTKELVANFLTRCLQKASIFRWDHDR
ncbi:hypothetical protein C2845_PM16G23080 [Panicum miliaceum]|uniref:BTB/POZ and MATH domain-containing protein 2-like n=1 Tax=Panicum miliaceum TaxID=4540 RepID=A0A3L6PWG3_PANMI|nr:hypothetical protein C2845_PM16G23080 [Panicum miliaceum]